MDTGQALVVVPSWLGAQESGLSAATRFFPFIRPQINPVVTNTLYEYVMLVSLYQQYFPAESV